MNGKYYFLKEKYINQAPEKNEVNWFDLSPNMYLSIVSKNKNILRSVRKLILEFGKNPGINPRISGVLISSKKGILPIHFPIILDSNSYYTLYALMISEGSFKTEFALNVPEKEFHEMFKKNLEALISKDIRLLKDLNHNVPRSRAPNIIRNILPFSNHLPRNIFLNKEFARNYLRVVFEAEGCPIFDVKRRKKYIKLSRNSDVSCLFKEQDLPPEKRIFINQIKKDFNEQYYKIAQNPDELILGEHLILKYFFDIDSTLKLESVRLNKLGSRKGKISAKWVLYIYSGEDLEKFNKEIKFLSKNKNKICYQMLKTIPSRRKQYFVLEIMKKVQIGDTFKIRDFNREMKKLGYSSPAKFVWDYWKNKKIIEKVSRGNYKLLLN